MKKNPTESYTMTFIGLHALIHNSEGKILIIQRCETNRYKPLMWDVPGGKKQTGESVLEGLQREVFEETGLKITSVIKPLSVFANTTQVPVREDVQIVFLCTVEDADAEIVLDQTEHRSYEWIDPADLRKYDIMAYLACYCDTVENCGD